MKKLKSHGYRRAITHPKDMRIAPTPTVNRLPALGGGAGGVVVVGLLAGDVVVIVLSGLPPPTEVEVENDWAGEYGGTILDDGMDRGLVLGVEAVVVVGNGGDAVVLLPPEGEDKAEDKGCGDEIGGEVLFSKKSVFAAAKLLVNKEMLTYSNRGGCQRATGARSQV
jgi:hypothetical protein